MEPSVLLKEISNLREIGNILIEYSNLEEVIQKAYKFSDSEIYFLKIISFLLAAYIKRIDRAKSNKNIRPVIKTHPSTGRQ